MKEVLVSAPGKVILHGEHSVVYGKAAVAAGVNLRTFLKLRLISEPKVRVYLPDVKLQHSWSIKELTDLFGKQAGDPLCAFNNEELVEKLKNFAGLSNGTDNTGQLAVIAFLYLYGCLAWENGECLPLDVTVASTQPIGAGLGSSASYSVCLATGLLTASKVISPCSSAKGDSCNGSSFSQSDKKLINAWAFEGERIIHGRPSGIDNSMATYGGALKFQAGKIEQLEKMPQLRILLTNTKIPRSTKVLVAGVREKYEKFPEIFSPVFDAMHQLSLKSIDMYSKMADTADESDYTSLEDLIDINQYLLQLIGVSHPVLENIVRVCGEQGVHTKLTGAGGGGCALSLLTPDVDNGVISSLKKAFSQQGFDCWETSVGGEGVLLHHNLNTTFTLPKIFQENL